MSEGNARCSQAPLAATRLLITKWGLADLAAAVPAQSTKPAIVCQYPARQPGPLRETLGARNPLPARPCPARLLENCSTEVMIAARHAQPSRATWCNLPPPATAAAAAAAHAAALPPSRRPRLVLLLLLASAALVRAEWKDCSTGATIFKARRAATMPRPRLPLPWVCRGRTACSVGSCSPTHWRL